MDAEGNPREIFAYFNEIGIIAQLSTTLLASVLPDGVHPSHFFIVNHLVRLGDGRTPVSIASAMQVTKATMTHSLVVLEKHGFIRTAPSDTDQRSKLVYLTESGRAFQQQAIAGVVGAFRGVFGQSELGLMREAMPSLVAIRKLLDDNRNVAPA